MIDGGFGSVSLRFEPPDLGGLNIVSSLRSGGWVAVAYADLSHIRGAGRWGGSLLSGLLQLFLGFGQQLRRHPWGRVLGIR